MEEFLKRFKNHSRAEQRWLSAVFEAVQQQLHPLIDASLGLSVSRLALAVLSKVQTAVGSDSTGLPVSYRFVSVSELIRDQRTACCSSLSWSSAHYREHARGAELKLPAYKALPRDNLLLIGCLCDGLTAGTNDGVWRVRDAGGSLACAMLKSSCLWLGRLMLFPSWNYIPHNAPGAGYLELLDPPMCVTLEAMAFDPGGALSEVMSVMRAAELLRQSTGNLYSDLSVSLIWCLLVCSVSQEAKHQYWRQCVCVGQSVCVSSLRVCSLQICCLVCVRRCTLVMERFMKTHFLSWKHLDQPSYITHKHCRVYLQLCVDDLTLISPSAAMSRCLMEDRQTDRESAKRPRVPERPLTPAACVSLLLRLESKQGVTLQNGFVCRAVCLGDAQRWSHDPKNHRTQEHERHRDTQKIELHFMGSCVRWFPVLHPGCVYRLIARNTEDVSVLKAKVVSARGGVTQLSSPALLLQPQWRIHTITEELPDTQSGVPALMSVSAVLHSSSAPEIVSFCGIITQRITLQEDNGTKPKIQSPTAAEDASIEQDLRVRLTVQDADCPGHVIDVYMDLSCGPYTLGLIAGAAVSVHHVQRKVSKACNVYCRSLPISCVSVTDLTSVCSRSGVAPSPPPMMLLGEWASGGAQRCVLAQVKGHVVCVLSLRLQWTCSLCGSIFRQVVMLVLEDGSADAHVWFSSDTVCDLLKLNAGQWDGLQRHVKVKGHVKVYTRGHNMSVCRLVLEDGSADAHVWFSSDTVCDLLKLNAGQWDGLQRHVKVKGHVKVYTRGHNMTCDEDPNDALVQYLSCVCSSTSVCRQIHLTCRLRAQRTGKSQLRKVHRGQTEFICKFTPALQLQCQHIHTR
ncbi:CST complex subunit CTC1 [Sinocyclocheilus grahami]|uniref:CST complex subunit CTC1 n=1 Tax=Sinocyclocheilus grahami TaxID=75366 RepID=UPI0007AD58DF|nr:PREDICTED: CST complex subunit CTC1-like [Sinocyclocheilus grahami]